MAVCNETIWITGATSGIGRALALKLARQGNLVIASGRSVEKLSALRVEEPSIEVLPFDVTAEDTIKTTQQRLRSLAPVLDRAILNAGDCEYLDLSSENWASLEKMVQVNFLGMVNSVRVCLPLLRHSERGHLIGVGSQAIFAPFPRAEGYGASKAAVSYFLSSLRMDVYKEGIDVTEILPGFVKTPLTARNDFAMPFLQPVDQAADRIVRAIEKRPFQYYFPKRLYLMLRIASWLPRLWLKLQARSAQKKN